MLNFEWGIKKAETNVKTHGVSFEEASDVFYDEFALELYDDQHSEYEENRFLILGLTIKGVLLVVYTVREEETYRIISAREATRREEQAYWDERKEYE